MADLRTSLMYAGGVQIGDILTLNRIKPRFLGPWHRCVFDSGKWYWRRLLLIANTKWQVTIESDGSTWLFEHRPEKDIASVKGQMYWT